MLDASAYALRGRFRLLHPIPIQVADLAQRLSKRVARLPGRSVAADATDVLRVSGRGKRLDDGRIKTFVWPIPPGSGRTGGGRAASCRSVLGGRMPRLMPM